MIAEYRYKYTDRMMIEGLVRFQRQYHQRYWLTPLRVFAFVGLSAFTAFCVYARLPIPGAVFAGFLILLLASRKLGYFALKIRLKKSPFFNTDVVVRIHAAGCVVEDPNSKSELSWPVFTGARRFDDGFLVLHGPQQYQWWPDSSLTLGSIAAVAELLRANVADFRSLSH